MEGWSSGQERGRRSANEEEDIGLMHGNAAGSMCHGCTAGRMMLEGACAAHSDNTTSAIGGEREDAARSDRWGQPARRSTSAMLKLCVAATLTLSMPRGAAGQKAFYEGGARLIRSTDKTKVCGAQTPPPNFVFPVSCRRVNPSSPSNLNLDCDAFAFSILTNASTALLKPEKRDIFSKGMQYLDQRMFALDGSPSDETPGVCQLPGVSFKAQEAMCNQNFQQSCGLQDMWPDMLVETSGICDKPVCAPNAAAGEPSCNCQGEKDVGRCNCLYWQRYLVRPTSFAPIKDASICWKVTLKCRNPPCDGLEERCVYVDMNVAPHSLAVSARAFTKDRKVVDSQPFDRVDGLDSPIGIQDAAVGSTFLAIVGQPLTLTVFAEDINTHQTLMIEMQSSITSEKPSVELPRQRWLTEFSMCDCSNTVASASNFICDNNNARTASDLRPCNSISYTGPPPYTGVAPDSSLFRSLWRRQIVYTPLLSEVGMVYNINLQVSDNGLSQSMLVDASNNFRYMPALEGTACGIESAATCTDKNYTLKPVSASVLVEVIQVLPSFEEDTPPEGAEIRAYANCPMPTLPFRVWKINAAMSLTVTFGSRPEDVAAGRKFKSPEGFAFTSISLSPAKCPKDKTNQHLYLCSAYGARRIESPNGSPVLNGIGVQWTPPLDAAGSTYQVCVVAQDHAPSMASRCVAIVVARCMYCTDTESLSHVAARFRTSWLQIWSSNDPEWVKANAKSLQNSKVTGWDTSDSPHEVKKGTLIRLGPVYTTRAEHEFAELEQRFGTTRWALLELNPDLRELSQDQAAIPMGQDVCILPGICSPQQTPEPKLPIMPQRMMPLHLEGVLPALQQDMLPPEQPAQP